MSDNKQQFWKQHAKPVAQKGGGRSFDKGSAVVLGGFKMDRRGQPIFNADGSLTGSVITVYGNAVAGVAPGSEITAHLNEATRAALVKGAGTDADPTTCILKGVRADDDGKIVAGYAHTLGEGRMAVVGVVEQPIVFFKDGRGTRPFRAADADEKDIEKLASVIAMAGKGVQTPAGQTKEQKWEANRAFPVSVSTRVFYPEKTVLVSSGADVEKLKAASNNVPGLRYAMRVTVVGADGQPVLESDKVVAFTPKFDKESGYVLPEEVMESIAKKAEAAGGTLSIEAIPYRTLRAAVTTDGTYDSSAVRFAKDILEQAGNARAAGLARATAYQPAFIVSTALKDEETGKVRAGVMVRLPEAFTVEGCPPVPSLKGLVTPHLDGSKIKVVQTVAAAAQEQQDAEHEAPSSEQHDDSAQAAAGADADEAEFDMAAAPTVG
ncbi:MAG: hypothetical protein HKL99_14200 [Burkholderiales bacterium]|nr:hypothetical protein [Burkholderiales bacterium]